MNAIITGHTTFLLPPVPRVHDQPAAPVPGARSSTGSSASRRDAEWDRDRRPTYREAVQSIAAIVHRIGELVP